MNHATLKMFWNDKVTLWNFQGWFAHPEIVFIAPPWKNNEDFVSCIPAGLYNLVPHNSEDHPNSFRFLNVPARDVILIHPFNYACDVMLGKVLHKSESKGCFGPGLAYDKKVPMVKSSVKAMNILRENIKGNCSIEVIHCGG